MCACGTAPAGCRCAIFVVCVLRTLVVSLNTPDVTWHVGSKFLRTCMLLAGRSALASTQVFCCARRAVGGRAISRWKNLLHTPRAHAARPNAPRRIFTGARFFTHRIVLKKKPPGTKATPWSGRVRVLISRGDASRFFRTPLEREEKLVASQARRVAVSTWSYLRDNVVSQPILRGC